MTISISLTVPSHCAAAVTLISNPQSDNPTLSETLIGPGGTYQGAIYDTLSIKVSEITTQQYNEATGVGTTASPLDAAAEDEAAALAGEPVDPAVDDRENPVGPGEDDDAEDDGI